MKIQINNLNESLYDLTQNELNQVSGGGILTNVLTPIGVGVLGAVAALEAGLAAILSI